MDGKMKNRCRELLKTLLIAVLTLSAILLAGRAQMYQIPAVSDWMEGIFSVFFDRDANLDGQGGPAELSTGLRPVCLAVSNESGRWGVHYNSVTLDTVFEDQLGGLLGGALADAGEPYAVSEEEWRSALCAQEASVYYDFLGSVPLSALSGWLGGEINAALTGDARRLLLASGGGSTAILYYCGGIDGLFFACSTTVEMAARVRAVVADYTQNSAVFAFEQEERYPNLEPYVMILPDPPVPSVYALSNPIGNEEEDGVMDALLRGLAFNPQTSAVYEAADGKRVREGMDTLRISADGTVIFHASDSQSQRYPVTTAGDTPSEGELVETARALVEGGLGPWCGDAGFYLIGAESGQDGSLWVYFGYLLDGAAVELGEDGYAAQVILNEGAITNFTLHFRAYRKTEALSLVLPEVQAVAAMNALRTEKSELLLRYLDNSGTQVTACWVAK